MPRPTPSTVADGSGDLPVNALAGFQEIPFERPLGVAVSGGGDSMALLAMAAQRPDAHLTVATVDHGLRADAKAEAAMVARFCVSRGIAHETLTLADVPSTGNLTANLRNARYDSLIAWAHRVGVSRVLLGHTMDDQAETVLLRLARGSGVDGLSAMARQRSWRGITWHRPLLAVSRSMLRDWLSQQGIRWVDDPTNEDDRFDRVKARRIMQAVSGLGLSAEGLAETATRLASQRQVLEAVAAKASAVHVHWGAFGEARLRDLDVLHHDTRMRLAGAVVQRIGGRPYKPRFRALDDHLEGVLAGQTTTLAGCVLTRDAEGIVLVCRELASVAPRQELHRAAIWDGRWHCSEHPGTEHVVGALGPQGCTHLAQQVACGWQCPDAWARVPRRVAQTVPAIFENHETAIPLAVPLARWPNAEQPYLTTFLPPEAVPAAL